MKRLTKFFLLFAVMALGCTGQAWAGSSHSNHTATATATVATGSGSVYVSQSEVTDQSNITDWNTSSSSTSFSCGSSSSGDGTKTAYAYAKAADGYNFMGWFSDQSCTNSVTSNVMNPVVGSSSTNAQLYAKFEAKKTSTITLESPSVGSYTATSGTKSANSGGSISTEDAITFTATVPNGYCVFGWYVLNGSTKEYFAYQTNSTSKTFSSNTTVGVTFISSSAAIFQVGDKQYYDLNEASTAANGSGTIIVNKSGTLSAGNYTIPSGVTLLVPMNSENNTMTIATELTAATALSRYRTLTLASGANIDVKGSICVAGQQMGTSSGSAPGVGAVQGAYGCIDMTKGGHIEIESGANLYAFGFITGAGNLSASGTITVKGNVYEDIVVEDMHGGGGTAATLNGTSCSNNYKLFPFNQYFVQNIEPKMTLQAGATEKVAYDIVASGLGKHDFATLVGSSSAALFQINSGSITKWYDGARDYQCYEVNGNMTMNGIKIMASSSIGMESSKLIMPITNNMDITVKKDATFTMPYDMQLQPGAKLTIEDGANVIAQSRLFVYDANEWKKFCNGYIREVVYAPGRSSKQTITNSSTKATDHGPRYVASNTAMADGQILVNGTLTLQSSGALYTTTSGAAIKSDGTGKIVYNVEAATDQPTIYGIIGDYGQADDGSNLTQGSQPSTNPTNQVKVGSYSYFKQYYTYGTPVACTPAQLLNGNASSYVSTSGLATGTTVKYANNQWYVWKAVWNDGSKDVNTVYSMSKPESSAYTLDAKTGYTLGWTSSEANNVVTYTAKWTANTYTVTFNANGGSCSKTSATVTYDATYGTLPTPTRTGYTFAGWYTDKTNGTQVTNDSKVTITAAQTLYAHWTANKYTVTFSANEGTCSKTSKDVTYDSTYGELPTPTRTGYDFIGWYTAEIDGEKIESTTAYTIADNQTLYAHWTQLWHAIWMDGSDTPKEAYAKSMPLLSEYNGTPSKTGMDFIAWDTNREDAKMLVTYTALFTASAPKSENAEAEAKHEVLDDNSDNTEKRVEVTVTEPTTDNAYVLTVEEVAAKVENQASTAKTEQNTTSVTVASVNLSDASTIYKKDNNDDYKPATAYEIHEAVKEATKNENTIVVLPASVTETTYTDGTTSEVKETPNVITKNTSDAYECQNLVITDGNSFATPVEFTASEASYSRTGKNAWGTICVPFALEETDDIKYYVMSDVTGGQANFTQVTDKNGNGYGDVDANTPVAYQKLGDNHDVSVANTSVSIPITTSSLDNSTADWKLVGTFKTETFTPSANQDKYYIASNKFWCFTQHTGSDVILSPFRAYIQRIPEAEAPARLTIAIQNIAGEVTALGEIDADGNLQMTKKILCNGKILVLKNGHLYDAAGQLVK